MRPGLGLKSYNMGPLPCELTTQKECFKGSINCQSVGGLRQKAWCIDTYLWDVTFDMRNVMEDQELVQKVEQYILHTGFLISMQCWTGAVKIGCNYHPIYYTFFGSSPSKR